MKGLMSFLLRKSHHFFSTNTTQWIGADFALYCRLGGEDTYKRAYVIFNSKIKANHALISYFKKTPLNLINEHQKNILSVAFGKEIKYSLKDLKNYHNPSGIRESDFDMLIYELVETFSLLGHSKELISEALGHLEKMRRP